MRESLERSGLSESFAEGSSNSRPLRVLMISHAFPRSAFGSPLHGVFVAEQLKEYRNFFDIYLMVPIDITPSLTKLRAQRSLSRRIGELSSHWRRTVLTHFRQIREPVPGEYVRFASVPPKSVLPFTVGIGQFLSIAWKTRSLGSFDVVHARNVLLGGLGGVLTARWLGVPSVVTATGSDIHGLKNPVEMATVRYVLRHADIVTCVSKDLGERVEALGIESDKIRVIGNGINVGFRSGRNNVDVRTRHGIPEDAPLVLYVGSLTDVKDPLNLVRAFQSVCEATKAHLVIVGAGVLKDRIREQILNSAIESRIHLVGPVPHEDVASYMSECSVFCLPSIREGWPNVLLEAMLFGKPVVATRVGGIPQAVSEPGLGILVEPANSDALGNALLLALNRKWDHGKIARYAEANSWAKAAEGYLSAYREAIQRRN